MSNPTIDNLVKSRALEGQVAIITGSSRGIGREMALTFARAGAHIVVAAKSTEEVPNLPGTIYTVAKEIEALGRRALPIKCDVRNVDDIERMVAETMKMFGRVDIMVANAGALWWKNVVDTPMSRYDLINEVNARGAFACARAVVPHMTKQGSGRIIVCSPPIDMRFVPGKVAYSISKFGMTLVAHGLGEELRGTGVSVNALWPATMVESFATINFKLGDRKFWRKASVLADAALLICATPADELTAQALIDEDFMRTKGITDFSAYRCDPNVEPLRMTPKYDTSSAVVHGARSSSASSSEASMFKWPSVGHVSEAAKSGAAGAAAASSSAAAASASASAAVPGADDDSASFPALRAFRLVHAEEMGPVLVLALNRRRQLNALSEDMCRELRAGLKHAATSHNIVTVVLTSAPGCDYFTSGYDLELFKAAQQAGTEGIMKTQVSRFLWDLMHFPKIVIAAVRGHAIGIGATVLPLCDFVYCTEKATFVTPFSQLGVVPEGCSTATFPAIAGTARANELLLLGRKITAADAKEFGLVNAVFATDGELERAITDTAMKLAHIGNDVLVDSKRLVRAPTLPTLEAAFKRELPKFGEKLSTEKSRRIMHDFLSQRGKL